MIDFLNHIAAPWLDFQLAMLWQTALLIAIVWIVDLLIRQWAWPQVRYALWLLVLVKLLIPPTLTSPASLTSFVPAAAEKIVSIRPAAPAEPTPAVSDSGGSALAQPTDGRVQQFPAPPVSPKPEGIALAQQTNRQPQPPLTSPISPEPGGSALAQPTDGQGQPSPAPAKTASLTPQALLLLAWLAGVAVLSAWLVLRLHALRCGTLENDSSQLPPRFHAQLQSAAARMGLRRLPRVVLTDKVRCPAVFGVLRPVLLIPADTFTAMTERETEHVLLHELAHIRRGDLVVHALAMVLQIAYWFNPLLWLIRRPIQHLRELCCDATVARLLRDETPRYRQTLLDTARRLLAEPTDPGLGLLGLFENAGSLLARLRWLEKQTWKHRRLRLALTAALVVLMAACILPMAQGTPYIPVGKQLSNRENVSLVRIRSKGHTTSMAINQDTFSYSGDTLVDLLAKLTNDLYPIIQKHPLPDGRFAVQAYGSDHSYVEDVLAVMSSAFDLEVSIRPVTIEAYVLTCPDPSRLTLRKSDAKQAHGFYEHHKKGETAYATDFIDTIDNVAIIAGNFTRKTVDERGEHPLRHVAFVNETGLDGLYEGVIEWDLRNAEVTMESLRAMGFAVTKARKTVEAVVVDAARKETPIDLKAHGITIRSGSEETPDYDGGSQLMQAYMEALLDGDEQTIADLTASADPAARQLRLSFNEVDKLRFFNSDSGYAPSLRRTVTAESPQHTIRLGLFSGGRVKRIDGLDYHLLALITKQDDGPWQLQNARWYPAETELAEAHQVMDRAMAQAIAALLEDAKPAGAESIDVREIEEKLGRVSEATQEAILKMGNAYDGPTLHGHKVTPAEEDVIPIIAGFIDALKTRDFEAKALRCPPALKPRLQRIAGQADLQNLSLAEIHASNSFAIATTEGARRHDSRPHQLGFTFIVYPGGQWVFTDADWLTDADRATFIDGFQANYPNVQQVFQASRQTTNGTAAIELLAIRDRDSGWWTPDGKPIDPPYFSLLENDQQLGRSYPYTWELVFRIPGLSQTVKKKALLTLKDHSNFKLQLAIAALTMSANDSEGQPNVQKADLGHLVIAGNRKPAAGDFTVGLSADAWDILSTHPAAATSEIDIAANQIGWFIEQPVDKPEVRIFLPTDLSNSIVIGPGACIAVDHAGRITEPIQTSYEDSFGKLKSLPGLRPHLTAQFLHPLSRYSEFQLRRPVYQWKTFTNVALRPGLKTEVQIETEKETGSGAASLASESPNSDHTVFLTPEHLEAQTVLSLKTGRFIPLQQARESREPYLAYNYTFPPGQSPSQYTIDTIPGDCIGVTAANLHLASGGIAPSAARADLWSIERPEQLPEFNDPRADSSIELFIGSPLGARWPYTDAFRADDGTAGVFEIAGVQDRQVRIRYKVISLPEEPKPANPAFTAALPGGTTVELLGIADIPAGADAWWAPDGTPLAPVYWETPGHPRDRNMDARQAVLRLSHNEPDPDRAPKMSLSVNQAPPSAPLPAGSYAGSFIVSQGRRTLEDHAGCSFSLHGDAPTVDIGATVSYGPWQTITMRKARADNELISHLTKIGTMILNDPTEQDGKTIITATLMGRVDAWRFVAVDREGTIHSNGSALSTHWAKNATNGFAEHQLCRAEFNLPLDQIQEFRFQTRPTQTVTFKNVALRPDQSTNLKIETSSPPSAKQPTITWQTLCESYRVDPDIPTQGSTQATDYGTVSFGNAYEKEDAAFIDITDSIDREVYEVRIVAVGPDNREIYQNGGGSSRFESTTQTTARFDVPLKNVQIFRLQTRPHPREINSSPTARDDRHFVGTYITDEMARLPKAEWSHLIVEIEYRDGQYYSGYAGKNKDPMEVTAAGLEFDEPDEHFTFTFDPAARTYQMRVTDPADGTLLKTWPLVKLTGPNSRPFEPITQSRQPNAGPFTATLPTGAAVTLAGISGYPVGADSWWAPDGSPIAPPPTEFIFTPSLFRSIEPDEQPRVFALKFADTGESAAAFRPRIPGSIRLTWYQIEGIMYCKFPQSMDTCEVTLEVASGPWKPVAWGGSGKTTAHTNDSLTDRGVIFHAVENRDGQSRLRVVHHLARTADTRVIVYDSEKTRHEPTDSESQWADDTASEEFRFSLAPEQIANIELQARPYQAVTFKNVALSPGLDTEVQIETAPDMEKPTSSASTDMEYKRFENRLRNLAIACAVYRLDNGHLPDKLANLLSPDLPHGPYAKDITDADLRQIAYCLGSEFVGSPFPATTPLLFSRRPDPQTGRYPVAFLDSHIEQWSAAKLVQQKLLDAPISVSGNAELLPQEVDQETRDSHPTSDDENTKPVTVSGFKFTPTPGDIVEFSIFELYKQGEETLFQRRISEAGTISLPGIDTPVPAAGKTRDELREEISRLYRENNILRNPVIEILDYHWPEASYIERPQPGDLIEISVYELYKVGESAVFERQVSEDRTISLPGFDTPLDLEAVGKTRDELRQAIARLYDQSILKSPMVEIKNIRRPGVAIAAETPNAVSNAKPEDVVTSPDYTATLPNGVSFELQRVGEYPPLGNPLWRPDGTSLGIEQQGADLRITVPEGDRGVTFFIDMDGPEEAVKSTFPNLFVGSPPGGKIYGKTVPGTLKSSHGKQYHLAMSLPKELKAYDLSFDVSWGDYEDAAVFENQNGRLVPTWGSPEALDFELLGMEEADGQVLIQFKHPIPQQQRWEYNLLALIRQGGSNQNHDGWVVNRKTEGVFVHTTYAFRGQINSLLNLTVHVRPHQWISFPNVALRPGVDTDVKIDTASKPSVDSDTPATGTLEFRIAPRFQIIDNMGPAEWTPQQIDLYTKDLQSNGPEAARRRNESYAWFRLTDGVNHGPVLTCDYKGDTYVLLCNFPNLIMTAEERWTLQNAFATTYQGQPAVGLDFDEQGKAQFERMIYSAYNSLAILINDEIRVLFRHETPDQPLLAQFGEPFTSEEVNHIVSVLRPGVTTEAETPIDRETASRSFDQQTQAINRLLSRWFTLARADQSVEASRLWHPENSDGDIYKETRQVLRMEPGWRFGGVSEVLFYEEDGMPKAIALSNGFAAADKAFGEKSAIVWNLAQPDGESWKITQSSFIKLADWEFSHRDTYLKMHPQAHTWRQGEREKTRNSHPVSDDVKENQTPFSVTGRVTDAQGNPLPGVTVRASAGMGTLMPTGTTVTDEAGKYRLYFQPGYRSLEEPDKTGFQAATIHTEKEGFYETNLGQQGNLVMASSQKLADDRPWRKNYAGVVLPNDPYELNFTLAPAAAITGTVTDPDGTPLPHFKFNMPGEALYPSTGVLANLTTDATGRFAAGSIPLKPYRFDVGHAASGVQTDPLEFNAPHNFNLTLVYDEKAKTFKITEFTKPSTNSENHSFAPTQVPQPQELAKPNFFKAPFVLNQDIPIPDMKVAPLDQDFLLQAESIRFEQRGEKVGALFTLREKPAADFQWAVSIELMDEQEKRLGNLSFIRRTSWQPHAASVKDRHLEPLTIAAPAQQVRFFSVRLRQLGSLRPPYGDLLTFEGVYLLNRKIPLEGLRFAILDDDYLVRPQSLIFEKQNDTIRARLTVLQRIGGHIHWQTWLELMDDTGTVLAEQTANDQINFLDSPPVEQTRVCNPLIFTDADARQAQRFRITFQQLGPICDPLLRKPHEIPAATVEGTVTGPDGHPLEDIPVQITEHNTRNSCRVPRVVTDRNGRFSLGDPGWPYWVTAFRQLEPAGHIRRYQDVTIRTIWEGPQKMDLQFPSFAEGTSTLAVNAVDIDGQPYCGYQIILSDQQFEEMAPVKPDGSTHTSQVYRSEVKSPQHEVLFSKLPAGTYIIGLYPEDTRCLPHRREVTLSPGSNPEESFIISEKRILYGKIVFEDGTSASTADPSGKAARILYAPKSASIARTLTEIRKDGSFEIALTNEEYEALLAGRATLPISLPSPNLRNAPRSAGPIPPEYLTENPNQIFPLKLKQSSYPQEAPSSSADMALRQLLTAPIETRDLKPGAPLADAIAFIQNRFDPPLPVTVDWNALAAAGVLPTDRAANRGLVKGPAGEILHSVLFSVSKDHNQPVDYLIRNGAIHIEINPHQFIEKSHPIDPALLKAASGRILPHDEADQWIMDQIRKNVPAEHPWPFYPGGHISPSRTEVICVQTEAVHARIADFLPTLKPMEDRHIDYQAQAFLADENSCRKIASELSVPLPGSTGTLLTATKDSPELQQYLAQDFSEFQPRANTGKILTDSQARRTVELLRQFAQFQQILNINSRIPNGRPPEVFTYTLKQPQQCIGIHFTPPYEPPLSESVTLLAHPAIVPAGDVDLQLRLRLADKLDSATQSPVWQVADIQGRASIPDGQTLLICGPEIKRPNQTPQQLIILVKATVNSSIFSRKEVLDSAEKSYNEQQNR